MASITKHKKGYRAQVYVHGTRDSAVLRTKREAETWAAARETELRNEEQKPNEKKFTLGDALRRYATEVSPTKRGARWEQIRLAAFERTLPIDTAIGNVTTEALGAWRDERLRTVSPGSVLREINIIASVFETAIREWGWLTVNPVRNMRKPRQPDHRDVIIKWGQIKTMLRSFGYRPRARIATISQCAALAFMVALRTGMRAGEICNLLWSDVHEGYCNLRTTKTKPRQVPLTTKTTRLFRKMQGFDADRVFGMKPQTLDVLFRRYRERAGLSGFTFHDSRHTAATWIAARMSSSGVTAQQAVLDMCKIFGWTNTSQALTYYNPKISDITRRLQ
jgi:integrase